MITFGERLADLRTEKRLSQVELAQIIGVGKSSLGMYETNKREPKFETLIEISKVFEVTTDYLLGLTDEKKKCEPQPEKTLVERIAAHMGGVYGLHNPEFAMFLNEIIKESIAEALSDQPRDEKNHRK